MKLNRPKASTIVTPVRHFQNAIVFLCLLLPSIWMLVTIPPLWRDADAYVQLTEPPLVATFWNHSPAYCYLAKIPLFIGEQVERWEGKPPPPQARLHPSQPALTDTGIWILIVSQHLGLNLAVFCFIAAATRHFWVRLALALVWASNALFYTLPHCVGSETLGVILVGILAVKALHLVRSRNEPDWKKWYLYAVVLLLCVMTRDLNLAFAFVLPAAFLTAWLQKKFARHAVRSSALAPELRNAVIALILSVACLFSADSVEHGLARRTRFHPHSRIGFTFLWRLHFLKDLPAESRKAILEKVKGRAPTDAVRYVIQLYQDMEAESADLTKTGPFMNRAIGYFGGSFHWEDLDLALNRMAFTFLWPPLPELLKAARADFIEAMGRPCPYVSEHLFAATTYYFANKEEISACANLVTFRGDMSADKLEQLFWTHRYFHLWNRLPYLAVVAIWLASLFLYIAARRRKAAPGRARLCRADSGNIAAYAVMLPGAGLAIFAASCLVHDYEPRFSLSMWQCLILSLLLLVGSSCELLLPSRRDPLASPGG